MRTTAHLGALIATLFCTAGLAGCRHIEQHFAPVSIMQAEPVAKSSRPRRSAARQLAKPEMVPAGARIRSFCSQRHIRFQSGALAESGAEKARNNELCRQVYTG